jgi:hypothetical protein
MGRVVGARRVALGAAHDADATRGDPWSSATGGAAYARQVRRVRDDGCGVRATSGAHQPSLPSGMGPGTMVPSSIGGGSTFTIMNGGGGPSL